jgi:lipid II:glycine glycyltransferase (peptidoglycan interpeptide bridge formation enzyme)
MKPTQSIQSIRNDELLQSEEWMRFQEVAGHRVVRFGDSDWSANGVVHTLPIVGKYLYVPRGPRSVNSKQRAGNGNEFRISNFEFRNNEQLSISNDQTGAESRNQNSVIKEAGLKMTMDALVVKAREMQSGWIRIEPESEEMLLNIREALPGVRIVKAPHDMQPREVFRVSLVPNEEELLAKMKSKARYNIRVAKKRGVRIVVSTEGKYVDAFIRLVTDTAGRKGVAPHPRKYYEKMCETLLGGHGSIFAAEKDGEIIAANLVIFHGDTATYLHGGSDDRFRADMAPYILQWEAMREAKKRGCTWYDFGGVNMVELEAGAGKWYGITRFKTGFSPETQADVYPGSYDIVLSPVRYMTYQVLQKVKKKSAGIIH